MLHPLTFLLRWNVFQIPFLYLPLSFTFKAILLPHLLLASLYFNLTCSQCCRQSLFHPTFLVKMSLILCPYSGLYLLLGLFPCLLRLWLILVPLAPYLLTCSPLSSSITHNQNLPSCSFITPKIIPPFVSTSLTPCSSLLARKPRGACSSRDKSSWKHSSRGKPPRGRGRGSRTLPGHPLSMCSTCFLLSIPTTFSPVRTTDPYWSQLLNSKSFYSIFPHILSLISLSVGFKNLFISLLILAFALPRMFTEYERKYNVLFDLGCRPLDPMVYPNFCSDREILCLKRHFASVSFCSSYMLLTFEQFALCFIF